MNGSFCPAKGTSFFLSATSAISAGGWFKIQGTSNSVAGGNDNDLCSNYYYSAGYVAGFYMGIGSLGSPVAGVGNGSSWTSENSPMWNGDQKSWSDGYWHHYILTFNGTYLQIYLDGIAHGTADYSSGTLVYNAASQFNIGAINASGDFMNGSIDEVGLWNRALTPYEVSKLYSAGSGNTYNFASNSSTMYYETFSTYSSASLIGQGSWITCLNQLTVTTTGTTKVIRSSTATSETCAKLSTTWNADQRARIMISKTGSTANDRMGVAVRCTGSGATASYYTFYADKNGSWFGKVINGTFTFCSQGSQVPPGSWLELRVTGNTFVCLIDGILHGSMTDADAVSFSGTSGVYRDTSITTGVPGITGYGNYNGTLATNYECDNLKYITYQEEFDNYNTSYFLGEVGYFVGIGIGLWLLGYPPSMPDGGIAIVFSGVSNGVVPYSVNPYSGNTYTVAIYKTDIGPNQWASIWMSDMGATGTYGGLGVCLRLSGTGTTLCGYFFQFYNLGGNYAEMGKITNGAFTIIGTTVTPYNYALGDTLKLKVVGNVITAYVNDKVLTGIGTSGTGSFTDNTYTSGYTGIVGDGASIDVIGDEFMCGSILW